MGDLTSVVALHSHDPYSDVEVYCRCNLPIPTLSKSWFGDDLFCSYRLQPLQTPTTHEHMCCNASLFRFISVLYLPEDLFVCFDRTGKMEHPEISLSVSVCCQPSLTALCALLH